MDDYLIVIDKLMQAQKLFQNGHVFVSKQFT